MYRAGVYATPALPSWWVVLVAPAADGGYDAFFAPRRGGVFARSRWNLYRRLGFADGDLAAPDPAELPPDAAAALLAQALAEYAALALEGGLPAPGHHRDVPHTNDPEAPQDEPERLRGGPAPFPGLR